MLYNIWCFFNRSSGFLERESHQQRDFPMKKDPEQLHIDQSRKLCCSFDQQNQIQPMLWMVLIFKNFYFVILLFIHIRRFRFRTQIQDSVLSTEGNKETVSLLVSVKSDTMTSSTALAVFGSVDEISKIVSAADVSAAVLNLFPWESLFVGDFLFLKSQLIY